MGVYVCRGSGEGGEAAGGLKIHTLIGQQIGGATSAVDGESIKNSGVPECSEINHVWKTQLIIELFNKKCNHYFKSKLGIRYMFYYHDLMNLSEREK